LIDQAPWLAKQLLTVDLASPVLHDLIRPQTDGSKAPILDIPIHIKPAVKTTIHWSRLPVPARTQEQIKGEVAAECRKLLADPIVVMDCEATGIDVKVDQPVSCHIRDKDGVELFNSRTLPTNPERLLFRGKNGKCAADINGIRPEHLTDEPTFDLLVDKLNATFKDRLVLVYNDPFDQRILQNAARARGVRLDDFPTTCVMQLFGRFDGTSSPRGGGYRWWSLTDACETMGIDTSGAHDAGTDTRLTLELVQAMAAYQPESQPALL
jgi:DNA polymerase III epsilon subunit-like protein